MPAADNFSYLSATSRRVRHAGWVGVPLPGVGWAQTGDVSANSHFHSLVITLPPLGVLVFESPLKETPQAP